MKREDVYRLIDGERNHQDEIAQFNLCWDERAVGSHLVHIASHLAEAQLAYRSFDSKRKALESVRAIAALAVRCMEMHETPARDKK